MLFRSFTAELAARILDGEELNSDGITGLLKQTVPDEDEEPVWKALDEDGEVFDDNESFDEFVDTWAMWQAYQKDYVTRCLERAARRRRRKKVPEQQMSLL